MCGAVISRAYGLEIESWVHVVERLRQHIAKASEWVRTVDHSFSSSFLSRSHIAEISDCTKAGALVCGGIISNVRRIVARVLGADRLSWMVPSMYVKACVVNQTGHMEFWDTPSQELQLRIRAVLKEAQPLAARDPVQRRRDEPVPADRARFTLLTCKGNRVAEVNRRATGDLEPLFRAGAMVLQLITQQRTGIR